MRASPIAILTALFATSLLLGGCDDDQRGDDDEAANVEVVDEHGDADEKRRDGLVAAGGDVELSTEDVIAAVERFRLLAPGVDQGNIPDDEPEWMKMPQARSSLVRNLVHLEIVALGAAHRDIEVDDEEVTDAVANHDQLQRYLPLFENGEDHQPLRDELAAVGLDIDDVRRLAHDEVLEQKLKDALAEEFTDEQLWAIYQEAEDRADIVAVRLHNTPASAEIDRAMTQYDREIRAEYRDNRQRYRTQPRVEATVLVAEDAENADTIAEAAGRLNDGEDAPSIADDLGLRLESSVSLRRSENRRAYGAEVGDTGYLTASRRGPYAWRIDERHESQPRSLDRPLRREIASRILREQEGITPTNRARAQEARQILEEPAPGASLNSDQIQALVDQLEAADFEVIHSDLFSLHGSPNIPHIGLAQNLFDAIGDADLDDPVTEPVLDRNAVYVARLVDRVHPDRETYDETRDEFREQFLERNRDRLVQQYGRQYQTQHQIRYNLGALDEHFGEIERKKPQPGSQPGPQPQ